MRPSPDRLLNPNIGDILHNFLHDKHYLILSAKVNIVDNIKFYDALHLETGTIEEIGYWNYLYMTSWEIVA